MTHTPRTSRRAAGITLIEMMVALAITTFVVLVVNQLFNSVIQVVGRGTQAGEILQRSRAFDEQIANETELILSGGRDPSNPYDWFGRMVGPKGREVGEPGGFLVVVQRLVQAPVTLEDQVKLVSRPVRSDQLMFIYDQTPLFDQTGKKRLPPLAPTFAGSYGGDMINSVYAGYVRLWYGHAVQLPSDDPSTFNLANHDIGVQNATNPNAVAQDWVLGRHALFLTGIDAPNNIPYGNHALNTILVTANLRYGGSLWHGLTDISDRTLSDVMLTPITGLSNLPISLAYQAQALSMTYSQRPLLTSAKPVGTNLEASNIAPSHTYFMGGVSDFIVEFAGDLVTGESYIPTAAQISAGPDGELDRDPEGRIKWYTSGNLGFSNPKFNLNTGPPNVNAPVTYPAPLALDYTPHVQPGTVNPFFTGRAADAGRDAFVWQNEGSNGFTSWPWMLRIRYRLHDRRGQFEGREITVNTATGVTEPEAGAWFETIIPVNHQGL